MLTQNPFFRRTLRLACLAALASSLGQLLEPAGVRAALLTDELSRPTRPTRVVEKVHIPMRDGVNTTADIIFPEPPGKYPTILIRTPYGRRVVTDWIKRGLYFASRGYVVVVQSVRGREDSEGEWQPWVNERKDGYDTLDWISRQGWSDGKVGMLGGSYLGEVQLQAAAESHPALKCIIPYVSGSDHFFGVPYDHGIFNLEMLDWLRLTTNKSRTVEARPLPARELLKTLPLSRLDDLYLGGNSPIYEGWLGQDRPSGFAAANFLDDLTRSKRQVPILHLTGWWDGAAGGVLRNWRALRQAGYRQQWLVIGFWEHDYTQWDGVRTRYADVDYGPGSVFDFRTAYLRFYDTFLKDKSVGLDRLPKTQLFVTGANEWRGFDDYPAADARAMTLYLNAPAAGSQVVGIGSLTERRPAGEASATYVYDPSKPSVERDVKFLGTTKLWFDPSDGDNLLFQTASLTEAVEIGGPVNLELYFSTSVEDTDFFALLIDIDETGNRRALTLPGKMRMRYLSGWENPSALTPHKIYQATIPLWDVAHRFAKGHRVGLAIRSEWFPFFARDLNTYDPIKDATRAVVARQTIYTDAQRPSALRFRLLPTK